MTQTTDTVTDERLYETAASAAWDFVRPKLIGLNKEKGLAGVWSNGFRTGWDSALRSSPAPVSGEVRKQIAELVPDDAERADDTEQQMGFRNAIEQVLHLIDADADLPRSALKDFGRSTETDKQGVREALAVPDGRVLTVFDWAYNEPRSGRQVYARTVEKAERLSAAGYKLTPVYTIDDPTLPRSTTGGAK